MKRMKCLKLLFCIFCFCIVSACDEGTNFAPVTEINTIEAIPQQGFHRVSQDETLYSVAWRYGMDYRTLAKRNQIKPPFYIHKDQLIYLRDGEAVQVSKTDSPNKLPAQKIMTEAKQVSPVPMIMSEVQQVPPAKKIELPTQKIFANQTPLHLSKKKWLWPTNGKIISTFDALHKGINIAGNIGVPIYAAANGEVVYAGDGLRGYGNLIILKHNSVYLSAYAHNRKVFVKEGEHVLQGQKIAEMGNTGTDKVMLHFEIRRAGKPVDPLSFYAGRR